MHIHYPDYIIHQSAGQLSDELASRAGRLSGCFLAHADELGKKNPLQHPGGGIRHFAAVARGNHVYTGLCSILATYTSTLIAQDIVEIQKMLVNE